MTGIAATAVFCLITAWNEFVFALVLTEVGGKAVTAPPSIPSEIGSGGIEWGQIAAKTFVFSVTRCDFHVPYAGASASRRYIWSSEKVDSKWSLWSYINAFVSLHLTYDSR